MPEPEPLDLKPETKPNSGGRKKETAAKAEAKGEKSAGNAPKEDISDLDLKSVGEVFVNYTVTDADVEAVGEVPEKPAEKAKLKWLPYASVAEGVAERFHMDAERIVLAGDSAGAQLSAQLAALITNPVYADALGIPPTIAARRLRGVALCCGIYDLGAIGDRSRFRSLYRAIGWAYSGSRDYRKNSGFLSTVSVLEHVGDAFPPTFVTAGNADPLLRQSQLFTVALIEAGVDVETLFYPEDHEPPLPHEYQFELDLEDARIAFTRLVAFFRRVTSTGEATRHPDVGEAP